MTTFAMRPTLRLLALAVALASFAARAASAGPALHPGFEGGWQSSTLLYDNEVSSTADWGHTVTGGGALDVSFARGFGLATGARYVCYADRVVLSVISLGGSGDASFHIQTRMRINYVAVPLLATFAPRPLGPRVGLGTEVAFLTSARLLEQSTITGVGPVRDASTSQDVYSGLNRVNLSLCGTLGWSWPLENHAAVAQVRFTRGLTDVARADGRQRSGNTMGLDATLGARW